VAKCALFIDYENVFKSLQGRNINLPHKQLAELIKTEAQRVGEVVYARAYAPWDIWPDAMVCFDRQDIKPEYVEGGQKDNADLVMSLQIQDFLHVWRAFGREEADTFILVTGDAAFVHVIKKLQEENKRVIVWGVEGSISARLSSRVAELVNMQHLLQKHGLLPMTVNVEGEPTPLAEDLAQEQVVDQRLRGMILRAESVMLQRGWVQVPFLTLQEQLSNSHFYGENLAQCRALIMKGLDLEMLETKKQPNPKRPGTETTFILLRKEHPVVAQTLRATSGVVAVMRRLVAQQGGTPFVPLERVLEAIAAQADDAIRSIPSDEWPEWIDLMVEEHLLRRSHTDLGEIRLALDESHPLVEQVVPGEDITPMMIRLVAIVDHYLTRTGYLWMSMGLLRQQLGTWGLSEMERAVRAAIEQGVIVVRQQSNQFGARPTTGAYLQHDHRFVQSILDVRNGLLDHLLRLYRTVDVLPRVDVVESMEELLRHDRLGPAGWLEILLAHQILGRSGLVGGEEGLALNRQHPVVARRASLAV
jgi:hypothetical protein